MSMPAPTRMGPPGHITSPQEPYPSPDSPSSLASATTTHRQGNFLISTRKLPISKSGPIDEMSDSLGIPVPEMIFGDNLVAIQHGPSGFRIEFNAYDALDGVDKTGEKMLQVAYARDWSRSRERTSAGIKEVVKPYDWSYSTVYRGTVSTSPVPSDDDPSVSESAQQSPGRRRRKTTTETEEMEFQPTETPIPIELLKRRDPILFFDDVMLYESELDDNGISVFSVKVRVHEQRMLLLCRLFMRLDNVVVRVRDTRVYVDFGTDVVTREYTIKEAAFDDVKKALLRTGLVPDALTVALRDGNKIAEILPVVDGTLDRVSLAS